MHLIRRIGAALGWGLLRLIGIARVPDAQDEAPPPPPFGKTRLHLFNGDHTREALEAYCFDAPSDAAPEPFTRDLPEAYVDTAWLEIRHNPDAHLALRSLGLSDRDLRRFAKAGRGPGWIIAEEQAFGGFPFRLHDTPAVAYLGSALVDANI